MGRPRKSAARTPEAREQEMIALAMDLAEQKLRDGSAPAPLVMLFAKAGLDRERLEREGLEINNRLGHTKASQIEQMTQSNEKLDRVFKALRTYQGMPDEDEGEDEDYR